MSGTPVPSPRINRRSWLATSFSGIVIGAIWGAGVGALASLKHPTLSVIGRDSAQIAILDTLSVRVLIILGVPDQGLIDQIPALMTMMRQRIDIVIGMPTGLATLGTSFASRWNVGHTIAVPDNLETSSGPNTSTRSTLTRSTALDLDGRVSLGIDIISRNGWNTLPQSLLWSATIVHGSSFVLLGADDASLLATARERRPLLIVAPAITRSSIAIKLTPGSIAVNSDAQQDSQNEPNAFAIVQTFPEDIARFVFKEEGIELPAWTTPGSGV